MRHYRVEDIEQIEVLPESFDFDEGFDIAAHAVRAFGSFVNDAEFGEVVWRFTPQAAPHARRFLFHPTQEVEIQSDGGLLVRFRASGYLEMCWASLCVGRSGRGAPAAALREMVQGYRRSEFPALP